MLIYRMLGVDSQDQQRFFWEEALPILAAAAPPRIGRRFRRGGSTPKNSGDCSALLLRRDPAGTALVPYAGVAPSGVSPPCRPEPSRRISAITETRRGLPPLLPLVGSLLVAAAAIRNGVLVALLSGMALGMLLAYGWETFHPEETRSLLDYYQHQYTQPPPEFFWELPPHRKTAWVTAELERLAELYERELHPREQRLLRQLRESQTDRFWNRRLLEKAPSEAETQEVTRRLRQELAQQP